MYIRRQLAVALPPLHNIRSMTDQVSPGLILNLRVVFVFAALESHCLHAALSSARSHQTPLRDHTTHRRSSTSVSWRIFGSRVPGTATAAHSSTSFSGSSRCAQRRGPSGRATRRVAFRGLRTTCSFPTASARSDEQRCAHVPYPAVLNYSFDQLPSSIRCLLARLLRNTPRRRRSFVPTARSPIQLLARSCIYPFIRSIARCNIVARCSSATQQP